MPEPRAQRTLVKSPPEIWAEISDAGTLARHLGEFGEIRITDQKAETTVVWEGDTARGTVHLEPSGWGTRVTITAEPLPTGDAAAPTDAAAEVEAEAAVGPEVAVEPEAAAEPEVEAPESQPEAEVAPPAEAEAPSEDASPEPEPVAEEPTPEPVAATPAPARRRGFFARLFGRRAKPAAEERVAEDEPHSVPPPAPKPKPKAAEPEPEPVAAVEPEPAPVEPEPVAAEPEPVVADAAPTEEAPPVVAPDLEGEILAAAAMDPERIEAVLVGVLDDLGSAHHRPFSRG